MAHDDHAVRLTHQIHQGVGQDAALDPAALFHAAGHAAVKLESVGGLHRRLIAAAAQGHVQRLLGHLLAFFQAAAAPPHADGEGQLHPFVQGADLVQQIEAGGHDLLHVALFHHGDVAGDRHPAQKAVGAGKVLFQRAVERLHHMAALGVPQVGHQLLVAVHLDDEVGRAAGGVFGGGALQFGVVGQIQNGVAARAGGGKGGVAPARPLQVLAFFLGALTQVQAGQSPAHRLEEGVLPCQQPLAEGVVVPHHRLAAEQRRGQMQRLKTQLQFAALEFGAADGPADRPAQMPPAQDEGDGDERQGGHQHQKAGRLQHRQNGGEHTAQRQQRRADKFQGKTGSVTHGTFASLGKRVRLPSEWAKSWGCAWCAGRYRRRASPARGS